MSESSIIVADRIYNRNLKYLGSDDGFVINQD